MSSSPSRGGRAWFSLALFVALAGYAAAQPWLNQQFGWNLPGLFDAAPQEQADAERDGAAPADPTPPPLSDGVEREAPAGAKQAPDRSVNWGELRDIGRDVKRSAAGLRYVPGSAEGHRLAHVLRHAQDDPDRPGSHGVFDGGRDATLAVIDEAYVLAQQGGGRVRTERDGDRMVHTIDMQRRIGFVGGRTGQRERHPPARRIRLVLEGDKVITAYPLR